MAVQAVVALLSLKKWLNSAVGANLKFAHALIDELWATIQTYTHGQVKLDAWFLQKCFKVWPAAISKPLEV